MAIPDSFQLYKAIPVSSHDVENLNATSQVAKARYDLNLPIESIELGDIMSRTNWSINGLSLAPLPAYQPLERTHCVINISHASPQLIAARISEACVLMSLAAHYNDEKCIAQLSSSDFCEMNVRLYTYSTGGLEPTATIVEVQRRIGDSLSFHRYARNLLGAAQGHEDLKSYDPNAGVPPIPYEESKKNEDLRKNAIAALEIAGGLLKKDRMDANQLGMESLCLLTDPAKTGLITATMVSRAILTGSTRPLKDSVPTSIRKLGEGQTTASASQEEEEEDALLKNLSIRKTILSLIQFKKISEDEEEINSSDDELSKSDNLIDDDSTDGLWLRRSYDTEHADVLHNLALAVLANSLDMISKDGSLCDTINQQQWLGDAEMVRTLLNVLRKAEERPHEAMLSARSLASLLDASTKAIEHAMRLDALSVVKQAKNIGRRRHSSLARESNNVYEALSSRSSVYV
jgi:hypothetical protein